MAARLEPSPCRDAGNEHGDSLRRRRDCALASEVALTRLGGRKEASYQYRPAGPLHEAWMEPRWGFGKLDVEKLLGIEPDS